jgi:hypothetical protein
MKYIFVSGAPGSKWSSVVKNIYYSPSVDSSDAAPHREYYHDASGELQLMHMGVYWGPAMEFGDWFERLDQYSREQNEAEFDRPFSGTGVRIIKSHVFGYHLDYIKRTWPDCPIVLIDRTDDACLGWWVKCGHFDITYPLYNKYYVNLKRMAGIIKQQNTGITNAMWNYKHQGAKQVATNLELCNALGIAWPDNNYRQNYTNNNIKVTVI